MAMVMSREVEAIVIPIPMAGHGGGRFNSIVEAPRAIMGAMALILGHAPAPPDG